MPIRAAASNWGYQLQGENGNPLKVDELAAAPHDMLVIDPTADGTNATRFSAADGAGGVLGTVWRHRLPRFFPRGDARSLRPSKFRAAALPLFIASAIQGHPMKSVPLGDGTLVDRVKKRYVVTESED